MVSIPGASITDDTDANASFIIGSYATVTAWAHIVVLASQLSLTCLRQPGSGWYKSNTMCVLLRLDLLQDPEGFGRPSHSYAEAPGWTTDVV